MSTLPESLCRIFYEMPEFLSNSGPVTLQRVVADISLMIKRNDFTYLGYVEKNYPMFIEKLVKRVYFLYRPGRADLLRDIFGSIDAWGSMSFYERAILRGHNDLAEFARKYKPERHMSAITIAIALGQLELAKKMHNERICLAPKNTREQLPENPYSDPILAPFNFDLEIEAAIKTDNIEALSWLLETRHDQLILSLRITIMVFRADNKAVFEVIRAAGRYFFESPLVLFTVLNMGKEEILNHYLTRIFGNRGFGSVFATPECVLAAIKFVNIEVFKKIFMLRRHNEPELANNHQYILEGAKTGNLEFFKEFASYFNKLAFNRPEIGDAIARAGNVELLEWVIRHQNINIYPSAMDAAAQGGHIDMLEWMYWHYMRPTPAIFMASLVSSKAVAVVDWLYQKRLGPDLPEKECFMAAIEAQNIELLKVLVKFRPGAELWQSIFRAISRINSEELFDWFMSTPELQEEQRQALIATTSIGILVPKITRNFSTDEEGITEMIDYWSEELGDSLLEEDDGNGIYFEYAKKQCEKTTSSIDYLPDSIESNIPIRKQEYVKDRSLYPFSGPEPEITEEKWPKSIISIDFGGISEKDLEKLAEQNEADEILRQYQNDKASEELGPDIHPTEESGDFVDDLLIYQRSEMWGPGSQEQV